MMFGALGRVPAQTQRELEVCLAEEIASLQAAFCNGQQSPWSAWQMETEYMVSIHYFLRCFCWPSLKKVLVYHYNELALPCCLLRRFWFFLHVGLYATGIAALIFLMNRYPQDDAIKLEAKEIHFPAGPSFVGIYSKFPGCIYLLIPVWCVGPPKKDTFFFIKMNSSWTMMPIVAAHQSVDLVHAPFLSWWHLSLPDFRPSPNHPGTGRAIGTIGSGTVLGDPRKGVRSQDVPGLEGSAIGSKVRWLGSVSYISPIRL